MKWGFTRPDGVQGTIELQKDLEFNAAALLAELHDKERDGKPLDVESALAGVPNKKGPVIVALFNIKFWPARTTRICKALRKYLIKRKYLIEQNVSVAVSEPHAADVRQPDHYAHGIDPLDYMASRFTGYELRGFLAGNVLKYISRYTRKDGIPDLEKARDYLERLIAHEREMHQNGEDA